MKSKVLYLSLCLFACKNRNYNANNMSHNPMPSQFSCHATENIKKIKPTGKKTAVFHYTNNSEVLTAEGFKKYVAEKFRRSATIELKKSTNAFGEGLYLAADPVTSSGYGKILVSFELNNSCDYGYSDSSFWHSDKDAPALIQSSAAGIVYDFGTPGRAIVLRTEEAIDWNTVRIFDLRNEGGQKLSDLDIFPSQPQNTWKDAMQHYRGFYNIGLAKNFSQLSSSTGGFFKPDHTLTDAGLFFALISDFEFGTLEKKLNAPDATKNYPHCGSLKVEANEIRSKLCFAELQNLIGLGTDLNHDPAKSSALNQQEAVKILGEIGLSIEFKEKLPNTVFTQKIFDVYLQKPDMQAKATAYLKALALGVSIKAEAELDNWNPAQ